VFKSISPIRANRSSASPILRSFALPNGDKIVSLRSGTFRSAVRAVSQSLREERSEAVNRGERTKSGR
jgi:Tfp pilus assembly protein FimT